MQVLTVQDVMKATGRTKEKALEGLNFWIAQGLIEKNADGERYQATAKGHVRFALKQAQSGWGR